MITTITQNNYISGFKTYDELISLKTFEERFEYCKASIGRNVGEITFGSRRFLNQIFYNSYEWKSIRSKVIVRDCGCDLAHPDYPITTEFEPIYIHHLNPLTEEDILNRSPLLIDLNNLICVSFDTHNAIHYNGEVVEKQLVIRKPNDTCPWR